MKANSHTVDAKWMDCLGIATGLGTTLLGPTARENYNGPRQYDTIFDRQRPHPTDKQRQDWLNLNRFLARLWQTDTAEFSLYGIWALRRHVKANITTAPTIQTVALTSP
ncbi:hypothetical protein BV898_13871 [Hypsibius exemplaris]|uniref:Uncharacterized protein n=1 Tax=Hypsibius exemplaris TaxID=2072580 RepID=A0A1W0W9E7_HYPEX|nr:hypothetical protein BV898_13871 [Hypsibius exemplaris]